ncbi:MAG: HAMP domain-containing protein [Chloroflexi bacterium]|nr:HAMP domain-containing protein [Chloroflexota bacterium]
MFSSLRVRLLASLLLVTVVAVGVVAALASQATGTQFRGYVQQRAQKAHFRFQQVFGSYYADRGSWDGVEDWVARMGEMSGDHIVLLDSTGKVIADSAGKLLGREASPNWSGGPLVISNNGLQVGAGYVNPTAGLVDQGFLDSVNRSLLLAAAGAGVMALLLTLVLSRHIVRPLQSLTAAAQRMTQGDLEQRVDVRSKDEIGVLAGAFNTMAESVARNEMLRRRMVSDVAHELRTPLTNVRCYLELLQEGVLAPEPGVLESLKQEADILSRLADDLQEIALSEAGQLRLERQPAVARDICERAATAMRAQAEAKGLHLEMDVPEGLPPVVVDSDRIGQVLRNLLSNALAHTPAGGSIVLSAHRGEEGVEISVADTGEGIPPQSLPYVFERFYRADPSRARATGGSGLGLTISKEIVEAHGGRMRVESELGKGAKFTFGVPTE